MFKLRVTSSLLLTFNYWRNKFRSKEGEALLNQALPSFLKARIKWAKRNFQLSQCIGRRSILLLFSSKRSDIGRVNQFDITFSHLNNFLKLIFHQRFDPSSRCFGTWTKPTWPRSIHSFLVIHIGLCNTLHPSAWIVG